MIKALALRPLINRTLHDLTADLGDLCIDRRCFESLMPKQFLNVADVGAMFQEMRGKGVPKRMGRNFLFHSGKIHRDRHPALQRAGGHVTIVAMLK